MIPLIIAAVLLLILAVILFGPVILTVEYKEELYLKVRYIFFKVYDLNTEEEPSAAKRETPQKESEPQEKKDPLNFKKLKEKYGFTEAIRRVMALFSGLLTHIKWLLRHIKINKVVLNITAASSDAASTAIEYGVICSAAYPVLGLLSRVGDIKYKAINISADFNAVQPQFDFSLQVKCNLFFLGAAALSAFAEYKKFLERQEENERK